MKFEEYCKSYPKFTISQNAYRYCKYVKDSKKIRAKISDQIDIVKYCLNVKDRKHLRKKISLSLAAFLYCRHIENRQSIAEFISCNIQVARLNRYLNGESETKFKQLQYNRQLAA